MSDEAEDANGNGDVDEGELDPSLFDTDGDGRVTRGEIPRSMRDFRDVVEESDRDGDGAASVEEVERFVERIFDDWEREDPAP